MGQKVNPIGLRLGINRTWDSRWFADDNYAAMLHEDLRLKKYLQKRLLQAGVSRIVIERPSKRARITIHTARPGVVIGKKGADVEKLRSDLSKMTGSEVSLNIVEIRKPEIDARLVAENIAQQLERRVAFRRAMKRAGQSAMRLGALGMRITGAGRCRAPPHEAAGSYLDPRVPGRSGVAQAGRSPHGFGQGHARILGGPRPPRPHHVRDRRRVEGAGDRGVLLGGGEAADQDAFRGSPGRGGLK